MKRALLILVVTLASCTPLPAATTASWYGAAYQGRLMANGRPFDRRAMTCASRTLPLGAVLRVTRRGAAPVYVTVTDRPSSRFAKRLDLSEAAFARLAPTSAGLIDVTVTRLR